jgi:SAM-dependent methyltransferase
MSRPLTPGPQGPDLERHVRAYWNERIHDLDMTRQPIGSRAFFEELDEYRFDKLAYLPRVIDFSAYRGRRLLEIGCGIGTDLVRFAAGGARVTGLDLSETAVRLARKNLEAHDCCGGVLVADGATLPFAGETHDVVYAHGVLQYAPDPRRIVEESLRVLKPGGTAIFMVYNRVSWLHALSKLMKVELEHQDAPVLRLYSIPEFRELIRGFSRTILIPERFPVRSRLHKGWKAVVYNGVFVGLFNAIPRPLVRRLGWHLMAVCVK